MLQYNSSLGYNQPVADPQQAMNAVQQRSPYQGFNQNHQDVMNMLGGSASAALNMEAYRANADYQLRQMQAQRQLALQGLQQQSEAQQNQQSLANNRLQNMVGTVGGLLGGLF